ncbi:hypothetical protein [Paenibacillus sp. FSL K6-1318]|uniref:hypothetical protein n=1 Tax=Paenibacillus sp. FSL K6-1318 TaxID=2975291 RepID=UPI0030ED37CF
MALTFTDYRNPSTRPEVNELISIIELSPIAFVLMSRVFNSKRKNHEITQPEYIEKVDVLIDKTFNSPRHAIRDDLKDRMKKILKTIYHMDSNIFNKIKSEILEAVVYRYGPYTTSLTRNKVFMEPTIRNEDELVGNLSKIDSVFYIDDNDPLEFVECKTNITTVIPTNLPMDRLSSRDKKKIDYLKLAHGYLSENFCSPEVYMACYNVDYNDQLENAHNNLGLVFLNFLNPEQVYTSICSK